MNPNPWFVNVLIVPSAICALPVVIAWIDAARLTTAEWSPSSVPGQSAITQVGCPAPLAAPGESRDNGSVALLVRAGCK
jgi:hypothetical protein